LFSAITVSCAPNSESESQELNELLLENEINCDTVLPLVLHLIELDSHELYLPPDWTESSGSYVPRYRLKKRTGKDSTERYLPFLSEYHDSIYIYGFDTIFTQNDMKDYYSKEKFIDTGCYSQYNWITLDSVRNWNAEYEKGNIKKSPEYFSFSRPLISSDKKYILFQFDTDWYGDTFLFEYKNGKWQKLFYINRWIS